MLLGNLDDLSLRKRYLAARTHTLKELDRVSLPVDSKLFIDGCFWMFIGLCIPVFGFIMICIYVMIRSFLKPQRGLATLPAEVVGEQIGHGLFIACVLGLIGGFVVAPIARWVHFLEMRKIREELGPLPADEPLRVSEVHKSVLEGGVFPGSQFLDRAAETQRP